MNWKKWVGSKAARRIGCAVLAAAVTLSLGIPVLHREQAPLENPLLEEPVKEITVLQAGEGKSYASNSSSADPDAEGSGGGQVAGETGTEGGSVPGEPTEDAEGASQEEQEENVEGAPEPESGPSLETLSESTVGSSQETDSNGEEGKNDGMEGDEGGEEVELDLAAVMSWYKYGSQEKTIVCQPGSTVGKEIMTAQLRDEQLRYSFSLTGLHADDAQITSVAYSVGNSVPRETSQSGSIPVSVPVDPGYRNYIFQVTALATLENVQGEIVEQELQFTFVIRCENGKDLELALSWQKADGQNSVITCTANGTAGREIKSSELTDGLFSYTNTLQGEIADNSRLVAGEYRTASGGYGTLELNSGSLTMQAAEGSDRETYYLSFTASVEQYDEDGERYQENITYTITIVYIDNLDLQLQFRWYEKGVTRQELLCDPNETVSQNIKSNQLSAGSLLYEMALIGSSAKDARIKAIALQQGGGSSSVPESGSLPMSIPEGGSSVTYVFQVTAEVGQQSVAYTVSLRLSSDVRLQMDYTLLVDGVQQTQRLTCENKRTVTAETVYDDQLSDGKLSYTMTLLGEDAQSIRITQVQCYQSGSMKTITLRESGSVVLRLEGKRTGENTFTVTATDGSQTYDFTINIPYKHRGENLVKIETNLIDGMEVTNDTEVNLTVRAWTEDENGNVVSQIRATGSETILTVTLDGQTIPYISSSGTSQEYTLVPQNPKVGDTNEHTLTIYAQDEEGNYGELTLILIGKRTQSGQEIGTAQIYIDMTVLGLGMQGPISYTVLSKEPVSYVVAKAVWGQDFGDPFGAAEQTFGYLSGSYGGTMDVGFYLRSLSPGGSVGASALSGTSWSAMGATEEEVLQYIDGYFGRGTGLATLWRCIYRNGLNLSPAAGSTVGEYDYTSGSGWLYSVGSGTYYPGQSMSDYYLQDGDTLVLRYSLAQGWDIGGGTDNYGNTVGYCVSAMNGSIQINHQMEEIATESGGVCYMCRCCGLTEDCPHTNTECKENDALTHGTWCKDCETWVTQNEEHDWQYTDTENPDTHTGTCANCGYSLGPEAHKWIVESDSATCTQEGEKVSRCSDCGASKTETYIKEHATGGNWVMNDNDVNTHYQLCMECGQEIEGSRGAHTFAFNGSDLYCTGCPVLHIDLEILYGHVFQNGVCTSCGVADPNYREEDDNESAGGGDIGGDGTGGATPPEGSGTGTDGTEPVEPVIPETPETPSTPETPETPDVPMEDGEGVEPVNENLLPVAVIPAAAVSCLRRRIRNRRTAPQNA